MHAHHIILIQLLCVQLWNPKLLFLKLNVNYTFFFLTQRRWYFINEEERNEYKTIELCSKELGEYFKLYMNQIILCNVFFFYRFVRYAPFVLSPFLYLVSTCSIFFYHQKEKKQNTYVSYLINWLCISLTCCV